MDDVLKKLGIRIKEKDDITEIYFLDNSFIMVSGNSVFFKELNHNASYNIPLKTFNKAIVEYSLNKRKKYIHIEFKVNGVKYYFPFRVNLDEWDSICVEENKDEETVTHLLMFYLDNYIRKRIEFHLINKNSNEIKISNN